MSEIVTLSKNSADFKAYLLGTFSKQKRALPIQTLNVNSSRETVTFEVKNVKDIKKPFFLILLLHLFKVRAFILILFPMYVLLVKNVADNTVVDPLVVVFSTLGILSAYVAVNLRNDYTDHMKGLDRVNPQSGSRVIQKGWMTAINVKRWATLFVFLSLALAAPVVLVFPKVLGVIALTLLVSIWAQFLEKGSFKYHKGGEIFVFLLLGPLLTTGYQISISGYWDIESLQFGLLWGWLVVFLQHLKNFEFIMINSQAGFQNTVTWLGFDKTKILLKIWWLLFLAVFVWGHVEYAGYFWTWFSGAVLGFCTIPFFLKINKLQSPVGSMLVKVRRRGYILVLIVLFLWTVENVWYWGQWDAWGI